MKNDDFDLSIDDDEETETIKLPPAKMTINVKSVDALHLTMTKACLESLTNLGKVGWLFVKYINYSRTCL